MEEEYRMSEEEDTLEELAGFPLVRGSDPRLITCRSKLQNKRSKLNQEINKEVMLRNGAENLFKATTNKKMRDTVALELSFVNSNLQLLKEQLSELNSSVEVYQNSDHGRQVPMIPCGLKETKDLDFKEPFKDFILEHYSEDGTHYEDNIQEFMDIRQAMRTPRRDASGISLLFEYFNQLYYIERRFFPPERSLGIYFEWFDSLTGVPSCQRTVAFEKASVLFNIGALYTQIGARFDRTTSRGLEKAVDSFLRAAGTFSYIHENFTNAPSMDLSPGMLEALIQLMLAQARECLFVKLVLSLLKKDGVDKYLEVGQEAAEVSSVYDKVYSLLNTPPVKTYVPYSWASLCHVKRDFYKALSHYYVAIGLLDNVGNDGLTQRTKETIEYLHIEDKNNSALIDIRVPKDEDETTQLGKAHLRAAVLTHEEALRVHRLCRHLRKQDILLEVLRKGHDQAMKRYTLTESEDDFQEVLDPPNVQPSTQYQLSLTPPEFSAYKVLDLFRDLGPVAIFSAKHQWTAPRTLTLRKMSSEGFGFSVRGDSPVIVASVDPGGLAELCGMKEGDFIVIVEDKDVKWSTHDEVVSLIRGTGNNLTLKVVTPMDRTYLKPKNTVNGATSHSMSSVSSKCSSVSSPHSTTSSTSSGVSSAGSSGTGSTMHMKNNKLSWNPFKKTLFLHKDRQQNSSGDPPPEKGNVILR